MLIMFAGTLFSCNDGIVTRTKNVTVKNSEVFEFDLNITGVEEGARIIRQALHFETSIIVRNAATNYNTIYRYKAIDEYYGTDEVEIETCTGGDGIRCDSEERLIIKIKIIP